MAEKSADGGTQPEEFSAPPEQHGQKRDRRAGQEHDRGPGGGRGRGDRWGDDGRDQRSGDEDDRLSDDEHDQRDRWPGDERDRRAADRYDRERWAEGPEDDGDHRPAPSGRIRFRRFRLAAWIALILAAAVVGASVMWTSGPPTEAELRENAGLFKKDRIRIGVKNDTPNIALQKETGSRGFEGFDIQIAYMLAADLGFPPDKVDFLSIETEDRARMQAEDDKGQPVKVDLVVATFSVTPEREADPSVGFSAPYLYTEQSVVTRSSTPSKKITSLGQLKGQRICTLGTSTSESELAKATEGTNAVITGVNSIKDCIDGLKDGAFEAVTTDAALLAGFVKESGGALVHHDIALEKTEMWAVNTGANDALRTLVDLSLYRSYADPQDQRWEQAYQTYIGPLLSDDPTGQTNANVAQANQPCVLPPPVRRWPWERTLAVQECSSS